MNKSNIGVYDVNITNTNEKEILQILIDNCSKSLINKNAFLLDLNKIEFNLIEKIVYDLSVFHLKNMNINILDNINIEFWFKTTGTYSVHFHTDKDDNSMNLRGISPTPLFTSLLYLTNNYNPTLITNIDENSYKYKNFLNENSNLFLFFPKKMKNLLFNPSFYHSELDIFDNLNKNKNRNVLVINVWKNYIPLELQFYENIEKDIYKKEKNIINIKKNDIIKNINIENEIILNNIFFTELLYNKSKKYHFIIKNILEKYINNENENNENNENVIYMLYNNSNIVINQLANPNNKLNFKTKIIDYSINNIIPDFIDNDELNTIKNILEPCGILAGNSNLFKYLEQNIFFKLYNILLKTYNLDSNKNYINIIDVIVSKNITINNNHTCIASIFIYDSVIKENDISKEEFYINNKTLLIKNNTYNIIEKNTQTLFIEFILDIW